MMREAHLRFETESGDPLVTSDDGIAHLESEFVRWRVRWIGERQGAMYARFGEDYVPLTLNGDHFTVPNLRRKKERAQNPAGDLVLFGDAEGHLQLRPVLRVHSANLSDEHYRSLLKDLGALIAGLSFYLSPREQERDNWIDSDEAKIIGSARFTTRLLEGIMVHLRRVRLRPAHTLVRRQRRVRLDQAIRHGYAAQVAREGNDRDHVLAHVLDYTEENAERAFVSAVVGALADQALALSALLELQSKQISERNTERESQKAALDRMGVKLGQPTSEPDALNDLGQQLARRSQDLKRVWPQRARREALQFRSNRLTLSQEYAPVLRIWREMQSTPYISQNSATLLEALDPISLDGTTQLYERWVLVKLYTALVERGFRPPDGEPSLLEELSVVDRALNVVGRRFQLEKQVRRRQLVVTLDFDRSLTIEGGSRQPDLVIYTEYCGRTQTWVLDAKYKDYSLPTPSYQREKGDYGSHFNDDLYGVAEVRYRVPLAARFSGILHPDTRDDYQFWDADPVTPESPYREAHSVPHEIASACLIPGPTGEANVTKLMRLLFGFHAQLTEICWRCGTEGNEVTGEQTAGTAYSCPKCQSFWVDHWCYGSRNHRLLKFGRGSFHKVDALDPFNVACPWCGRQFTARPEVVT